MPIEYTSTDGKVVSRLVALVQLATLRGKINFSAVRFEGFFSAFSQRFEELKKLIKARYLVDPASSHMLVSKIKPCMSKYKPH